MAIQRARFAAASNATGLWPLFYCLAKLGRRDSRQARAQRIGRSVIVLSSAGRFGPSACKSAGRLVSALNMSSAAILKGRLSSIMITPREIEATQTRLGPTKHCAGARGAKLTPSGRRRGSSHGAGPSGGWAICMASVAWWEDSHDPKRRRRG